MLGVIAAIALVVGTVSATVSVTRSDQQIIERSSEPVVQVQTVEGTNFSSE